MMKQIKAFDYGFYTDFGEKTVHTRFIANEGDENTESYFDKYSTRKLYLEMKAYYEKNERLYAESQEDTNDEGLA